MRSSIALALLVSLSAQAEETKMTSIRTQEDNKQVVRRIFEDGVNSRKMELLNQLIADDYVGPQGGTTGPAAFTGPIQGLIEGFPDIHYKIEDLVAEGDRVALRWRWDGTHRGTYRGPGGVFAPTGKHVANDGMAVFQLKDGKVQRSWLITDRLGFLQEIGALPKGPGVAASAGKR
jgi:predicted ester cyclase